MGSQNKELHLFDFFQILKNIFSLLLKKWKNILLGGVFFGLIGVAYAWLSKPSYVAKIICASEGDKQGGLSGYMGIASQFGIDLGGSGGSVFQGDNLVEFLQTKFIIRKTLFSKQNDKTLLEYYINNHKLNKNWNKIVPNGIINFNENDDPNRIKDSIVEKIVEVISKKQYSVNKPDKKLSFIQIQMKDVNEDFSKLFVETLVNNTVKFYADYKTKRAQRNYDLIKHQVDSIKQSLLGNIETIAETNDLNVNPIKQKVRASSQKTQVDASANAALYQELLKQMGLAQITLNRETPLIQIIDRPVLPLLNEKPSRLITGILFAIIGGFFISIFIILSNSFAERNRKSFHS